MTMNETESPQEVQTPLAAENACCSTVEQTECCAPSDKASCCAPEQTAGGSCGCK